MSHIHNVIDTDPHYKIDGITRTIVNIDETKRALVQGDHNSERFTFEIPRHVDGHDFSKCNVVQVHYENRDTYEKIKSSGIYNVEDLHIKNDDDKTVVLSWLIHGNGTKHIGTLDFVIRFACITNGILEYAWNTTRFKGISILEGLDNSGMIAEQNSDIIASLTAKILELEDIIRNGNFNDDNDDDDNENDENVNVNQTSMLGAAQLGKMILGMEG